MTTLSAVVASIARPHRFMRSALRAVDRHSVRRHKYLINVMDAAKCVHTYYNDRLPGFDRRLTVNIDRAHTTAYTGCHDFWVRLDFYIFGRSDRFVSFLVDVIRPNRAPRRGDLIIKLRKIKN